MPVPATALVTPVLAMITLPFVGEADIPEPEAVTDIVPDWESAVPTAVVRVPSCDTMLGDTTAGSAPAPMLVVFAATWADIVLMLPWVAGATPLIRTEPPPDVTRLRFRVGRAVMVDTGVGMARTLDRVIPPPCRDIYKRDEKKE